MVKLLKVIALLLLAPLAARAVVIVDANGTSRNSGATGIGVEDYVGQVNGASGIYLGDGWVLSAGHVGAGDFTLNGQTYNVVADSAHAFYNADTTQVDLVLFQISITAQLPGAVLFNGALSPGMSVYMLGYGGGVYGWGQNSLTGINSDLLYDANTGFHSANFYTLSYDYPTHPSNYAQAISGDSGGAGFVYHDGQWQLAGVMFEIGSTTEGGPPMVTYFVNLTDYYGEIRGVMATSSIPEPATWALMVAGAGLALTVARRR